MFDERPADADIENEGPLIVDASKDRLEQLQALRLASIEHRASILLPGLLVLR
jgi:hypothetical protein